MRRFLKALLVSFILTPCVALAQVPSAAPALSDCSIASLSGSSQSLGTLTTLAAHAFNRKYLLVCNTGATGDNVGVNFVGTTAALGGTGTVTLVPGACKEFSTSGQLPQPPSNAVTVIGTSGQPVLCLVGH